MSDTAVTTNPSYIVICQNIVGGGGTPFETIYTWDGERFDTRSRAETHGFRKGRSDDFNIGIVGTDESLRGFFWMEKPVNHDLSKIADQIGLRS